MAYFGAFYLDKEKDIIVELDMDPGSEELSYCLRTPHHATGNLITNLARLCKLPLSRDSQGLLVIKGKLPCYINSENRLVYVCRLLDTKVANIFPDGTIERKASIPAISKTLMSQTKDYHLDFKKTLVKTYIFRECKFRTDVHTHMNANLDPDCLIALGIHHQIRYPLYYIRKLSLKCTEEQENKLAMRREKVALSFQGSPLTGKYLDRKINDATFINFADLILNNPGDASYNLSRIRASLAILKDGQAVFTNLEKVYLYRYVFCKGVPYGEKISYAPQMLSSIPDRDIVRALHQMADDRNHPVFGDNTLFQDKLLWIARSYASRGIQYVEISDTSLAKPDAAPQMLALVHAVMPEIQKETGVTIRFLAAVRRTPLTIVKDQIADSTMRDCLQTIRSVAMDPYVAGSDIIGEEINDIRDLAPLLTELVHLANEYPDFTIRIHAGENDGLRDNVYHALKCVQQALGPTQKMPKLRIGHGLYTANLKSAKGIQLMQDLVETGTVLEFQITSNVRLNNLSSLENHPLKTYLHHGVACVQGTDGGAIYGTDSIDEQLSLEKLLNLTYDDLMAMKRTDEHLLREGMDSFRSKLSAFKARNITDIRAFYTERIIAQEQSADRLFVSNDKLDSHEIFHGQDRELPVDRVPLILCGGSFNQDTHRTRMRPEICHFLDQLLSCADPEKVFFVLGPELKGYENYLYQQGKGRFDFFAFVPSRIPRRTAHRLKQAQISIRISIEPSRMAIYKSYAYEIFKRRPSVLIALDGNTAAGNLIQEAKNGKRKAAIFVSRHAKMLSSKARTLDGYAAVLGDIPDASVIVRAIEHAYPEKWMKTE